MIPALHSRTLAANDLLLPTVAHLLLPGILLEQSFIWVLPGNYDRNWELFHPVMAIAIATSVWTLFVFLVCLSALKLREAFTRR